MKQLSDLVGIVGLAQLVECLLTGFTPWFYNTTLHVFWNCVSLYQCMHVYIRRWMCVWVCVLYLLVLFRGVLYLLFCRSPLTGGREPAHDLNSIDGDSFACQPYLLRGVWLSSVHFMVERPNVLCKLFTLKTVVWIDDVWDFHNEHHLHLHVRQLHF